jgi:hypothetical protein
MVARPRRAVKIPFRLPEIKEIAEILTAGG